MDFYIIIFLCFLFISRSYCYLFKLEKILKLVVGGKRENGKCGRGPHKSSTNIRSNQHPGRGANNDDDAGASDDDDDKKPGVLIKKN